MRTTIYGYIEEMDFWERTITEKVRTHNTNTIWSLPKADVWPPLSREMFAICENDELERGPNFEYSGRIVHFGANLKAVEYEWDEWRIKFEAFLQNLLFLEARVHFKTEYSSLATYSWIVDVSKYRILHDGQMPAKICKEHWEYESNYE